ncbi:hypothetical protein [Bradyrhizobium sp. DASA03120]|uniref:hypothetical protein n=1 Tax=Bradyrhizobium sp. SMVTL-02 TaxID=3395917 RepID=UPI003F7203A7
MIEAVYGDRVEPVPAVLHGAEMKGAGKDSTAKTLERFNVVDLAAGYGTLPSDLRCDEEIGTRLGEETVTVRLARREGESLAPWFRSDGGARLNWALSELRVRKAFWGKAAAPGADAALPVPFPRLGGGVEGYQHFGRARHALEGEDIVPRSQRGVAAHAQAGMLAPERDQRAKQRKNGTSSRCCSATLGASPAPAAAMARPW